MDSILRKARNEIFRYQVLSRYSNNEKPKCVCCGESRWEVLTLDHSRNDGAKYRHSSGKGLYYWLKARNFPKNLGLKTLCFNCNAGRWVNGGVCPHRRSYSNSVKKEVLSYDRRYSNSVKKEVLSYYSKGKPKCSCCKETLLNFLTIDHIKGGGNKHRKQVKYARSIHKYLRKLDFPDGYRVLCYNCNFGIRVYDACPHRFKESPLQRYKRLLSDGALLSHGPKPQPVKKRFLSMVHKTKTCWLWDRATFKDGTGAFTMVVGDRYRVRRANIVAYELFKGDVKGRCVRLRCKMPGCVRPSHLYLREKKMRDAEY